MVGIFDEQVLKDLYAWIDRIPLSRPKRNFGRDFSDGVLVAEIVMHYFPRMVEMHNYNSANGTKQKLENWHVLNRKVFPRLNFELSDDMTRQVADCKPQAAEQVLLTIRSKIDRLWTEVRGKVTPRDKLPRMQSSAGAVVLPPIGAVTGPLAATTRQTRYLAAAATQGEDLRNLLDEKEQLVLEYEDTIQIMQAKIHRLERLVQLKDIRIDDLQSKLDAAQLAVGRRA